MGGRIAALMRVTGALLELPSQCLRLARELDAADVAAREAYRREAAFRSELVEAIGVRRFAGQTVDDAAIIEAVRGLAVIANALTSNGLPLAPPERRAGPDDRTVRLGLDTGEEE